MQPVRSVIGTAVPPPLSRSRSRGAAPGTLARRRPLWMWWHLLSLDAPTIAVLWAHLFSHVMQVRLSGSDAAVNPISLGQPPTKLHHFGRRQHCGNMQDHGNVL